MIKINDIDLPKFPSEYKVLVSDIDDASSTGRTMDGLLHRDRIAVKQKIELSFNMLTGAELSLMLNLISDIFFDVTYPDPLTGLDGVKTFYVGNRTAPIGKIDVHGNLYWTAVTFNFIER